MMWRAGPIPQVPTRYAARRDAPIADPPCFPWRRRRRRAHGGTAATEPASHDLSSCAPPPSSPPAMANVLTLSRAARQARDAALRSPSLRGSFWSQAGQSGRRFAKAAEGPPVGLPPPPTWRGLLRGAWQAQRPLRLRVDRPRRSPWTGAATRSRSRGRVATMPTSLDARMRTIYQSELERRASRFARPCPEDDGVAKGATAVCIYLPMIPGAAISARLRCAIGAIHSVVFGGFSAHARCATASRTPARS